MQSRDKLGVIRRYPKKSNGFYECQKCNETFEAEYQMWFHAQKHIDEERLQRKETASLEELNANQPHPTQTKANLRKENKAKRGKKPDSIKRGKRVSKDSTAKPSKSRNAVVSPTDTTNMVRANKTSQVKLNFHGNMATDKLNGGEETEEAVQSLIESNGGDIDGIGHIFKKPNGTTRNGYSQGEEQESAGIGEYGGVFLLSFNMITNPIK